MAPATQGDQSGSDSSKLTPVLVDEIRESAAQERGGWWRRRRRGHLTHLNARVCDRINRYVEGGGEGGGGGGEGGGGGGCVGLSRHSHSGGDADASHLDGEIDALG